MHKPASQALPTSVERCINSSLITQSHTTDIYTYYSNYTNEDDLNSEIIIRADLDSTQEFNRLVIYNLIHNYN